MWIVKLSTKSAKNQKFSIASQHGKCELTSSNVGKFVVKDVARVRESSFTTVPFEESCLFNLYRSDLNPVSSDKFC